MSSLHQQIASLDVGNFSPNVTASKLKQKLKSTPGFELYRSSNVFDVMFDSDECYSFKFLKVDAYEYRARFGVAFEWLGPRN